MMVLTMVKVNLHLYATLLFRLDAVNCGWGSEGG
jgi:hypothetical protein